MEVDNKNSKTIVFLLNNKNSIEVLNLDDSITIVTTKAFNNKSLLGLEIIDSNGKRFKITSVKKRKNLHPFWKFEFFNPLIKVKLDYEPIGSLTLEDFKKKILVAIEKDKEIWKSAGPILEIKNSINQSSSFKEIARLLSVYEGA